MVVVVVVVVSSVVVVLSVVVVVVPEELELSFFAQEMRVRLKRKRERIMSRCFTKFPIS